MSASPVGTAMLEWAIDVFGQTAANLDERALRFVEEAIELMQSRGIPARTLYKIVDRVYSRRPGVDDLEFDQCAATLETYAALVGTTSEDGARREWARVQGLDRDELRDRHRAKVALGISGERSYR